MINTVVLEHDIEAFEYHRIASIGLASLLCNLPTLLNPGQSSMEFGPRELRWRGGLMWCGRRELLQGLRRGLAWLALGGEAEDIMYVWRGGPLTLWGVRASGMIGGVRGWLGKSF